MFLKKITQPAYARRKIDVEPIFGKMKASLRFNRFSVRGLEKVKNEAGIVVMALNILKLTAVGRLRRQKELIKNERKAKVRLYVHFLLAEASFVTAPFAIVMSSYEQATVRANRRSCSSKESVTV